MSRRALSFWLDDGQPDAPPVDPVAARAVDPPVVDGQAALIAALQATIAAMKAQLAAYGPTTLEPLKGVAIDTGIPAETLRRWCVSGKITATLRNSHWFVDPTSVRAFKKFRLAGLR